jgi:hypothetical protein
MLGQNYSNVTISRGQIGNANDATSRPWPGIHSQTPLAHFIQPAGGCRAINCTALCVKCHGTQGAGYVTTLRSMGMSSARVSLPLEAVGYASDAPKRGNIQEYLCPENSAPCATRLTSRIIPMGLKSRGRKSGA